MTIALIVNGVTFDYPEEDDEDWGPEATDWAAAVTSGMLQKAGGLFTLTADADFGPNFGLKSSYYKSRTADPSSTGQFRLAKTDSLSWRNNANSADLPLSIDSLDRLTYNGVIIGVSSSGDVVGPASATANAIALFNSTSGKLIKDGGIGTSDQVLVGGTTPGFGNTPAASLPLADTSTRGAIVIKPPTIQKFLSGSGTYTTPAGVAYLRVRMVGGGGGGSGSGTTVAGSGGAGGNTTFGTSLLTANGGLGGVSNSSVNQSSGGTITINSPAIGFGTTGGDNGTCAYISPAAGPNGVYGSDGAASPFGGAGRCGGGSDQLGSPAKANTGSGGGGGGMGATGGQLSGGGGAAGGYIDAIIPAPSATYAYSVGAAGTAGTAGTSGHVGYAGGSGLIIVEEYYY